MIYQTEVSTTSSSWGPVTLHHSWGDTTFSGVPAESDRDTAHGRTARNSAVLAVASATSRALGFVRTAALAAVLGIAGSGLADAYNGANELPTMLYELLAGGVLSSAAVPFLVRARSHSDGGQAALRRLLITVVAVLSVCVVVLIVAAPAVIAVYFDDVRQQTVATRFAYLLMPEVLFYGIAAVAAAGLNSRNRFAASAWAPALNNAIVIGAVAAVPFLPGPRLPTLATISDAQVVVIGLGTSAGVVFQAALVVRALRRSRPQRIRRPLDASPRRGGMRSVAAWALAYVAISQVGLLVVLRIAAHRTGWTTAMNADLLFQVPFGVLAVSVLTSIMPGLSSAAAADDRRQVLDLIGTAAHYCTALLLPVTALLTAAGPALTTVLYAHGATSSTEAARVGTALAFAAFGLIPFAVVMLQLRVCYALGDGRTPVLVNTAMVLTKITLAVMASKLLHGAAVVVALPATASTSFVVGAVVGSAVLRRRLGSLGLARAITAARRGAPAAAAIVASCFALKLVVDVTGLSPLQRGVVVSVGGLGATAPALLAILRRRAPRPG